MTSETWGEDGKLRPAGYRGPPPILETAETVGDDGGGWMPALVRKVRWVTISSIEIV